MPRATNNVATHRRHKRLLKRVEGYRGGRGTLFKVAKESSMKAGVYAYRDRRNRKRDFRRLWITRISAAVRARGINYSRFMQGLVKAKIELNRKMLSEMAIKDPAGFDAVVAQVQKAIA